MIYGIIYSNSAVKTANTPEAAEDLWAEHGSLTDNSFHRPDAGPTSIIFAPKWLVIEYCSTSIVLLNNMLHRVDGPARVTIDNISPYDPLNYTEDNLTEVKFSIRSHSKDLDEFYNSDEHQMWLKENLNKEERMLMKLSGPNKDQMIQDTVTKAIRELTYFDWNHAHKIMADYRAWRPGI